MRPKAGTAVGISSLSSTDCACGCSVWGTGEDATTVAACELLGFETAYTCIRYKNNMHEKLTQNMKYLQTFFVKFLRKTPILDCQVFNF